MIIKASASITLTRVDDGDDGKGIKSIVNKYLASSSGSNVTTATSGWTDSVQTITTGKRYLWNYEVITYTDNSTTTTTPVIIGVYGNTGSTGATGNGISSITEYYLVSPNKSGVTTSTSGWSTSIPAMTATNKYLWNYEVIKYTNSTTSTGTPKVIGVYGDKGDKGETGVGISSVDVEYYLSTSSTAQSGGSWSTTAPTWVDGKYMWSRTKTVTTAGKTTYSNPVCITGGKGNTGATGATGATGKGVSSITEEYYLSTSKTTQTGGSWTTTPPTWSSGKYMWTRSKIVYTNPASTVYTAPVCDSSWEAVNDLQLGGRNLLFKTDTSIYGLGNWVNNGGVGTLEGTYGDGTPTIKITGSNGICTSGYVKLRGGSTFVYSMMMKSSGDITVGASKPLHMWLNTSASSGHLEKVIATCGTIKANTWTKAWIVFQTPSNADTYYMRPFVYGIGGNTIYICKVKIEEGNMPTDWTPAPEDVDSAITSVDNKVTTTNNKVATIETNLNGITSRVSKTESTLTTTTNTANSALANANAAASSANSANSKIDNLQVGGRNLIKNSNFMAQATSSTNAAKNSVALIDGVNLDEMFLGKTVTFSYFVNCPGARQNGSGSLGSRFGIHGSVLWKNSSTGATTVYYPFADCLDGSYTNKRVAMTVTLNPPSGYNTIAAFSFSNQPLARPASGNSATWKIGQPKLEIGNRATEWTPAPEDTEKTISSLETRVSTAEQKITSDAIVSTVTSSTSWSTVSGNASNALNTANTAKSTATNANNTANSALSTANSALNNVNNLQIGGRNLWRFTREYDGTKYNGWVDNNDAIAQAVAPYTTVNGFGVQRIASAWIDRSQRATIEANTNYTLSAWIKWESTAGEMRFYTKTGTMSGTNVTSQVGTTEYKRVSVTFNSGNATVSTCRFECTTNTPYLIYGLKLEKGTKATDWSPAPEDIDNSISSLTERVSRAEQKITDSAIISTVQSTINTAKNEAINSANSSTDTKLKNYSTTTQMNSAIQQSANSITSTVSSTYLTKGDATNTYATKTSLTQTANNITAKFTSNGGYNLLKNGLLKNGTYAWNKREYNLAGSNLTRNFSVRNDSWTNHEPALQLQINTMTSGEFGFSQGFTTVIGKKYVFTCYLAGHRSNKNIVVRGTTNSAGAWLTNKSYGEIHGGTNLSSWTKVVVPFTAQRTYTSVEINITSTIGTDGYVWAKEMMVSEGDEWKPYSPHPSEIYEGSTVIDASGVTVKNGALKVENNAGTTVLQGNTSGTLYLKDGGIVVAGTATDVWNNYGYRNTLKKNGIQFNWDASDSGSGSPPVSANVYLDYSRGQLVLSGGTKTPGIYIASGLEASSITTSGSVTAAAESRFSSNGTYSDPWNGTACAIKASGHIATTGDLKANGAINANGGININSGNLVLGKANTEQQIYFSDCSSDNRNVYFYKGGSSSTTRVGLYDKEAGTAVWRYVNDNTFVLERQLIVKGHVVPHTTRAYWIGTNSPDKKWKGLCAEGGTVGASDIRNKENIERLDGTIVTYDEVSEEINEYQLYNLRSTARASARDYYEFIKDRFKPSYYNYKLSEVVNEETGEYTIDPADEYDMLKNVGFIAQDYDLETDSVAREFIFQNESGEYSYNHMSYVTVGMIALQEATKKIESLENSNKELLNKNKELEDRLKILEDLIISK